MSSRVTAIGAAVVALALVAAQDVVPAFEPFHQWQYALALAILAWVLCAYAAGALRGSDGSDGKAVGLAVVGALVVLAAGLASGLLGPDTTRVVRAPGTVAPLPDVRGAAFFGSADAAAIERGDASVVLRRRSHKDIVVTPGERKFLGASVLLLEPRSAAYIEATDAAGNRLTITQPSGPSFLSPVLLFRDEQMIAGATHRIDAFTLPARRRVFKVVYFSAAQLTAVRPTSERVAGPALLYAASDAQTGRPLGIILGASGVPVRLADVRLRAVLGSSPALVIASAPHPYALFVGIALFVIGLGAAALVRARTPALARRAGTTPI